MVARGQRPAKIATLVARQISADIHARGNRLGDRLPPERTMLEQYQVGRGTLREALRFLELQGIISLKPGPGGGPVVERPDGTSLATSLMLLLQFDRAEYRAIAEARAGLEPMMAQLAATRMPIAARAALRETVEQMASSLANGPSFFRANRDFHVLIAHGSENALFGHLVEALLGILDGSSLGISYPLRQREAMVSAHAQICDAIEADDPAASAEAMAQHIADYLRYAEARYPEVLATPVSWSLVHP